MARARLLARRSPLPVAASSRARKPGEKTGVARGRALGRRIAAPGLAIGCFEARLGPRPLGSVPDCSGTAERARAWQARLRQRRPTLERTLGTARHLGAVARSRALGARIGQQITLGEGLAPDRDLTRPDSRARGLGVRARAELDHISTRLWLARSTQDRWLARGDMAPRAYIKRPSASALRLQPFGRRMVSRR